MLSYRRWAGIPQCSTDRMLQNESARTTGVSPTIRAERGVNHPARPGRAVGGWDRQTPATEVIQDRLYATLP
jgi:hypothetical protein